MKELRKQLFKIIEKSKEGTNFDSEKQFSKLQLMVRNLPKETVELLFDEWCEIRKEYRVEEKGEFERLHISNGGIVNGSDDRFYGNFGAWVIAQGEELLSNFKKYGCEAIIEYILSNEISEYNYTYECMEYAFTSYLMEDEIVEINKQLNNI
ncbi:UNVERIFIED_ORG: hypothetical protein B2H93_04975 [Clostridium botulinum]